MQVDVTKYYLLKQESFVVNDVATESTNKKARAKQAGKEWTQVDDKLDIPSQKKNVQTRRGKVYED